MKIEWAQWYRREWDERPEQYADAGIVGWGRSRRLGKARDDRLGVKAFIGVQHNDPGRWNLPGEPSTRFFLSLFIDGQTISLRTYPTIPSALAALALFHATAQADRDR